MYSLSFYNKRKPKYSLVCSKRCVQKDGGVFVPQYFWGRQVFWGWWALLIFQGHAQTYSILFPTITSCITLIHMVRTNLPSLVPNSWKKKKEHIPQTFKIKTWYYLYIFHSYPIGKHRETHQCKRLLVMQFLSR